MDEEKTTISHILYQRDIAYRADSDMSLKTSLCCKKNRPERKMRNRKNGEKVIKRLCTSDYIIVTIIVLL